MISRIAMIVTACMAAAGAAFAGDTDPAAFVTGLYGTPAPSGHYEQTLNIFIAEARDTYLSKRLRAALAGMDKRTPEGDAPDLDFDPVSASQDPDVRDLRVKIESESAGQAVVTADFQSHQDKKRTVLRYTLVREDGGWKVDDIAASGASDWLVSDIVKGH